MSQPGALATHPQPANCVACGTPTDSPRFYRSHRPGFIGPLCGKTACLAAEKQRLWK